MTPPDAPPSAVRRSVVARVVAAHALLAAVGAGVASALHAGEGGGAIAAVWALAGVWTAAGSVLTLLLLSRGASTRAEIARSIRRVLSGDARHRAHAPPGDESEALAAGVNEMAERLASLRGTLASVRNELSAILQSMDGGVLVLDLQQRVLSLNRAAEWMLGVTESQAQGRLLQEATRQPELNRYVGEALGGRHEESELTLLGQQPRSVRATHSRLLDAEGRHVGLLVVLTDITRLRRLESVRSDFASNVSHELRTPITNIKGYVETLLESDFGADREQTERFLRVIARNADRLGAIVEDMLMLTQLERPDARESLDTQPTRLSDTAEAVIAALEGEASIKSIRLVSEVPEDLFAQANPPLIEQALSNLVVNAIRYSPAGTSVWIRAAAGSGRLAGRHVEVEVVDEGPGIAQEHLMRIFERFYRVDKARSREGGGTGLGLAIVKHIVQLHAGRVEVESAPGKGSSFRLLLPAS